MSRLTDWWQQRKQKKADKLKEAAMKELYMVRMGDASDEANEHAAMSLLKAVSAGAEFDYTDPVFCFWKSNRGVDAMHMAAEKYGNRENFRKKAWTAGFTLCGLLVGAIAMIPALAAVPTVFAGMSVKAALGIIGALCGFGALQEGVFALFDKTKENTVRLSNGILRDIRNGGIPPSMQRSHERLRAFFKNLNSEKDLEAQSQAQQTEHRRKKWPMWYQKLFLKNYQFKEETKKVA